MNMIVKRLRWAGRDLVSLYGEGEAGQPPAQQMAAVFGAMDERLGGLGLSLENAVRHRIWTSDRPARDATNAIRTEIVAGARRCATSSFIARERFIAGGDVAVGLIAQVPAAMDERRLTDFDPPRRYAWYLVQGDMFYLSGMAEEGATLEDQFAAAFGAAVEAMAREQVAWRGVLSASLFIERGCGEPNWLMDRFRRALPLPLPTIACEEVDGLASPGKHLEIEITAARGGREG